MKLKAEEILTRVNAVEAQNKWAMSATQSIREVAQAVLKSGDEVNRRIIIKTSLMAETLLNGLEMIIEAHDAGTPQSLWAQDYNKIPAYARKVVEELNAARASTPVLSGAHFAALEASYGDVEVENSVNLPALRPDQSAVRKALDFKGQLLSIIEKHNLSYVSPHTLKFLDNTEQSITFAHADQAQQGIKRGGSVKFKKGQSWLGVMTWTDMKEKGVSEKNLMRMRMTEVLPGERRLLPKDETYVFCAHAQKKSTKIDSRIPSPDDAGMIIIRSTEDAYVEGPAVFAPWDNQILGDHVYKKGLFGGISNSLKPDGSLWVTSKILLSQTSSNFDLLPVMMTSAIRDSVNAYDADDVIPGSGPNTLLRYMSKGHRGESAMGTFIVKGLMPADLRRDTINMRIDVDRLGLPCALTLNGAGWGQEREHVLISVERTDQPATGSADMGNICNLLARNVFAQKALGKAYKAPLLDDIGRRIEVAPVHPQEKARLFILSGDHSATIKVAGPVLSQDSLRLSAALLSTSPENTLKIVGTPDPRNALASVDEAVLSVLPGYVAENFWITEGGIASPTLLMGEDEIDFGTP